MTDNAKKKSARVVADIIRDCIAVGGWMMLSAGVGLQFGVGYALIAAGAIPLGLVIMGSIKK